jgi:hypothetical protein
MNVFPIQLEFWTCQTVPRPSGLATQWIGRAVKNFGGALNNMTKTSSSSEH